MSDWKRRTKDISLASLRPETANAFREHIERHNLGPILSEALICIQTDSEKPKKGLFGKAELVKMVVILTPRWLLWSIEQPNAKAVVLSAQLANIIVRDYAQTPFVKMVPDCGIEVSGMFTDASESVSAFIGLEEGEAGDRFKELIVKTVQAAKK